MGPYRSTCAEGGDRTRPRGEWRAGCMTKANCPAVLSVWRGNSSWPGPTSWKEACVVSKRDLMGDTFSSVSPKGLCVRHDVREEILPKGIMVAA